MTITIAIADRASCAPAVLNTGYRGAAAKRVCLLRRRQRGRSDLAGTHRELNADTDLARASIAAVVAAPAPDFHVHRLLPTSHPCRAARYILTELAVAFVNPAPCPATTLVAPAIAGAATVSTVASFGSFLRLAGAACARSLFQIGRRARARRSALAIAPFLPASHGAGRLVLRSPSRGGRGNRHCGRIVAAAAPAPAADDMALGSFHLNPRGACALSSAPRLPVGSLFLTRQHVPNSFRRQGNSRPVPVASCPGASTPLRSGTAIFGRSATATTIATGPGRPMDDGLADNSRLRPFFCTSVTPPGGPVPEIAPGAWENQSSGHIPKATAVVA